MYIFYRNFFSVTKIQNLSVKFLEEINGRMEASCLIWRRMKSLGSVFHSEILLLGHNIEIE